MWYILFVCCHLVAAQNIERRVGRLTEVFAWRQLTYDLNGFPLLQDRFGEVDDAARVKRQSGNLLFNQPGTMWGQQPNQPNRPRPNQNQNINNNNVDNIIGNLNRPTQSTPITSTTPRPRPRDESGRFFIQYNNLPMGVERVGNRLFVTVPRRRYGIPSTLNTIDLTRYANEFSPPLSPYPDVRTSRTLVSVYRTRADACGRLWMVDTGLLEVPDANQQLQPPAIVVFDLNTDRQILRYPFKSTDLVSANTPAGLASITVDVESNNCADAFAYVPDLTTYGLIVYSLRENDSWRVTHNFYSFNPVAGNLNIGGQRFQWNDGIFSMTLSAPLSGQGRCKYAYFHPLASTQEFSVPTCVLQNRTASQASDYWSTYNYLGERGDNTQSTMHGYHAASKVMFFAEVGRDAVSCWNTGSLLQPTRVEIVARDHKRLVYPCDLHVTGDEVWVMSNNMPRFAYGSLDTTQYNFHIYRATVRDLISGTVCAEGITLGK